MTVKGVERLMESTIFAGAEPLPRGPHELSREQVAASQRNRLMAAFAELMAVGGYSAVNISELVGLAGVSRATFYQHFADKEQCMLAAYEQYAELLMSSLAPLVSEDAPTIEIFIDKVVSSYIAVIDQDPTAARAFFVELDGAGPRARARRRRERQAFISLFEARHAEFRERDPSLGPLPPIAYEALVDAAREVVRDRLDTETDPDLAALIPDLTAAFSAMFRGADSHASMPRSDHA
ncbi:MAG: TetR/AcrR family transcriptional regulator [Marmoricola sp.]